MGCCFPAQLSHTHESPPIRHYGWVVSFRSMRTSSRRSEWKSPPLAVTASVTGWLRALTRTHAGKERAVSGAG